MRSAFFEYYIPTDEEFKELWSECIFVLDANIMLNLYRYSEETSMALIDLISNVSKRLWVPHQAALEYHKNRITVISQQQQAYSIVEKNISECKKKIRSELLNYRKDSIVPIQEINSIIEQNFTEILKSIDLHKNNLPDYLADDKVLHTLTGMLNGKVGDSFSQEKLDKIYKEGKIRYEKSIPPGFEDAKTKPEPDRYGDLIVWYQIIEKAKQSNCPIIFVTEDRKKDWWLEFEGKIIGPKRELLREISEKANAKFYMYNTEQFMRYSKMYIHKDVKEVAIEEVQNLRITDELKISKEEVKEKFNDRLLATNYQMSEILRQRRTDELSKENYHDRIIELRNQLDELITLYCYNNLGGKNERCANDHDRILEINNQLDELITLYCYNNLGRKKERCAND